MTPMAVLRDAMVDLEAVVRSSNDDTVILSALHKSKAAFTTAMRQVQVDVSTAALSNGDLDKVIEDRKELEAILEVYKALRSKAHAASLTRARKRLTPQRVLH